MRADGNQPEAVRFDGETLTLRIPMRFQRHGGRKLIIAPNGEEDWVLAPTGPDTTLIRSLGRTRRWKRLIENGTYCSIKELATAEKVNDSYVCRILRLTLLAPDIVDVILNGRQPKILQLKDLMRQYFHRLERAAASPGLSSLNPPCRKRHRPPARRSSTPSSVR